MRWCRWGVGYGDLGHEERILELRVTEDGEEVAECLAKGWVVHRLWVEIGQDKSAENVCCRGWGENAE